MLLGVFLPFFHFLIILLRGRFFGPLGVQWLTLGTVITLVVINLQNFVAVLYHQTVHTFLLGDWLSIGGIQLPWEFRIDFLAVSMLAMVSCISAVVHIYSLAYMQTDPSVVRFMSFLSFFTFFMFVLVTAANFLVLFVGWEGVGLCSYLLINFWYTRLQANKSALKAMVMNRVGDIGFLLGFVLVVAYIKTADFAVLTPAAFWALDNLCADPEPLFNGGPTGFYPLAGALLLEGVLNIRLIDVISLCFFVGVFGKSAQLGLHTWLPAAMEGPTPVSAIIHAATMVTAGVFLLLRLVPFLEYAQFAWVVVLFGAVTAAVSAITAMFLFDIKKIIAYSTCSQLGYMMVAVGLSQYELGLFHLINHAFFKALLFLTAGAIIHSFNNEQDIRRLSNLSGRSPFLHGCILIGTVAIMGLPFLSGFYSKDIIIESIFFFERRFNGFSPNGGAAFVLIILATTCTGIYSMRLYYFLFLRQGVVQYDSVRQGHSFTQPFFIQVALTVLMVGSIFSGFLFSDVYSSANSWSLSLGTVIGRGTAGLMNGARLEVLSSIMQTYAVQVVEESDWNLYAVDSLLDNYANSKLCHTNALGSNSRLYQEFLPWFIKLLPLLLNLMVLLVSLVFIFYYQRGTIINLWQLLLVGRQHILAVGSKAVGKIIILQNACKQFWLWSYLRRFFFNFAYAAHFNFYFNELYNYWVVSHLSYYYTHVFLNLDKGLFELLGPTFFSKLSRYSMGCLRKYYKQSFTTHLFYLYSIMCFLSFFIEYWLV